MSLTVTLKGKERGFWGYLGNLGHVADVIRLAWWRDNKRSYKQELMVRERVKERGACWEKSGFRSQSRQIDECKMTKSRNRVAEAKTLEMEDARIRSLVSHPCLFSANSQGEPVLIKKKAVREKWRFNSTSQHISAPMKHD